MDTPENHVTILIKTVPLIIVFYPLLIGKYQGCSLEADTMFSDIGLILYIVLLDQCSFNHRFHELSITKSITYVKRQ